MRPLGLVVDRLAEVVEQPRTTRDPGIEPGLGRHHAAQVRHLDRVREDVLPVGRAVAEPTEEGHDPGMRVPHVAVVQGLSSRLGEVAFHRASRGRDGLLDALRMDATVGDQGHQRPARDLAPDGIESRDRHDTRRVVDEDVTAGRALEHAHVASLATDDAAFHVVADLDERDGLLGGVRRRDALDGRADDRSRAPVGLLARRLARSQDAPRLLGRELAIELGKHLRADGARVEARGLLDAPPEVERGRLGLPAKLLERPGPFVEALGPCGRLGLAAEERGRVDVARRLRARAAAQQPRGEQRGDGAGCGGQRVSGGGIHARATSSRRT